MSEKLTCDQMREARIRMEGEAQIRRNVKQAIANRMKTTPVMDMDDELTKVKAQRDALLAACEATLKWATTSSHKFDGSFCHFAEIVVPQVSEAIAFAKNK